jgi:hypothetical protein
MDGKGFTTLTFTVILPEPEGKIVNIWRSALLAGLISAGFRAV